MSSKSKNNHQVSLIRRLLAIVVLVSLVLEACQTGPEPLPVEEELISVDQLYANPWVLVAYGDPTNPTIIPVNTTITAEFTQDSKMFGNAGCNQYQTVFEATGQGSFSVEPPATTRMMCPENLMEIEQAYLQALEASEGFDFSPEGRLVIKYKTAEGQDADLVFAIAQVSLVNTAWSLFSYGNAANPQLVPQGLVITAQFSDDGMVSGSSGCNNYTAGYTIEGDTITIETPASTMMMCPNGMQEESVYLTSLSQAESYLINGPNLQINLADNMVLIFTSLNLPLEKTLWTLVNVEGQPLPAEMILTAFFEPDPAVSGTGAISGQSGCNQYGGGYQVTDNSLAISNLFTTMMACDESVMEVETAYIQALSTSQTFAITGMNLMISTEQGVLTFSASRTPLTGALWVLTALGDINQPETPVTGSNFTAQFTRNPLAPSGVVSGTTGCNEYAAVFSSSLTEIKINLPVASQNQTCVPGLVDQEQLYYLALNSATEFQIIGDVLVIPYDDGRQALVFEATQVGMARFQPLINLNGTSWHLWTMNDQPVIPGSTVTAAFTVNEDGLSGKIDGSAGCNLYEATFGQDLGVQTTLNSQQNCTSPAGLMDQEAAYLQALGRTYGFWLTGDQLILNTGLGALTFRTIAPPQSADQTYLLQANQWFLFFYNTFLSTPGPEGDANLVFNPDFTLTGYTGCNQIQGRYSTNINQLTVSEISTTKAACGNSVLTQQERAILDILGSAQTYQVVDTSLQIVGAAGVLNFTNAPVNRPDQVTPPTAKISSPDTGLVDKKIVFDGSQSTGAVKITRYQWDFGDGGRGEGKVVEYKYSRPGKYLVQMTVTDQRGWRDSDSKTVEITSPDQPTATTTNQPPVEPTPTSVPTEVTPTLAPTLPPDVTATPQPTLPPDATATTEPTLPPEATATTEPTLPPEATPTEVVPDVPPVAAIQGPGNGFPGEPVTFDASGSQAGSSPIVSYAWNFGDGTSAPASGNSQVTTLFNHAGSYTVTVTVTDERGLTSQASLQINVQARLEGPVWVLSQMNNQLIIPGTTITLQFSRGQLAGFSGCNSYTGTYTAVDNGDGTYSVTVQGINSTKLACPGQVMQQENTFISILASVNLAVLQGNILDLTSPNGRLLFYELGTPAPR
jgi:heat shock protein HslJ